jgi:choline-glycine betaine transporter
MTTIAQSAAAKADLLRGKTITARRTKPKALRISTVSFAAKYIAASVGVGVVFYVALGIGVMHLTPPAHQHTTEHAAQHSARPAHTA